MSDTQPRWVEVDPGKCYRLVEDDGSLVGSIGCYPDGSWGAIAHVDGLDYRATVATAKDAASFTTDKLGIDRIPLPTDEPAKPQIEWNGKAEPLSQAEYLGWHGDEIVATIYPEGGEWTGLARGIPTFKGPNPQEIADKLAEWLNLAPAPLPPSQHDNQFSTKEREMDLIEEINMRNMGGNCTPNQANQATLGKRAEVRRAVGLDMKQPGIGGSFVVAAEKISGIDESMRGLEMSISSLTGILGRLEERLIPVCRPGAPKGESGNKQVNGPVRSSLELAIHKQDLRVFAAYERIVALLERLAA